VIFIVPELLPPTSPILSVPAVTWKISDCLSERWFRVSPPRLIAVEIVLGAIVTTPPGFSVNRSAESSIASEMTFICPVELVLVKSEELVNEEVWKTMSPAIVFGAEDGRDIAPVLEALPTSSAFALEEMTILEFRDIVDLKLASAGWI
jgi:hypothetical protein